MILISLVSTLLYHIEYTSGHASSPEERGRLQDEIHTRQRSRSTGKQASPQFRSLLESTNSCPKLFDLMSLGNDILEAERERMLQNGELAKLRRAYRVRRGILSEGNVINLDPHLN